MKVAACLFIGAVYVAIIALYCVWDPEGDKDE